MTQQTDHIGDTNKMVTAVDWLVTELNQKVDFIPMNKWDEIRELVQQAKQMEKEQMFKYIENLYVNGDASREFHKKEFEQYYNETYKK